MKLQEFIDKLDNAGWRSPHDAQHTNIKKLFEELFPKDAEIERLERECEDAEGLLQDIGDFAHARSTGPANPDDLWEVRRMAYQE